MQHNVEILCKTLRQSMCKICVHFCGILKSTKLFVENQSFTHTFSLLSTKFSTGISSLFVRNVFHFSTMPTITTTNNIK